MKTENNTKTADTPKVRGRIHRLVRSFIGFFTGEDARRECEIGETSSRRGIVWTSDNQSPEDIKRFEDGPLDAAMPELKRVNEAEILGEK